MIDPLPEPPERRAKAAFAHASEAEMARILDFYAVRWEYEPDTFPILWNLDGDVVESFSPDFFLPDLDIYLEMTTLRQKLVRKKNRKLRRLRELYPDVRIKLFYARDFRQLMLKYGKLALVAELSGTPGQVGAPVLDAVAATGPADDAPPVSPVVPALASDGPSPAHAATTGTPPARTSAAGPPPSGSPRPARRRRERRPESTISVATEGPVAEP